MSSSFTTSRSSTSTQSSARHGSPRRWRHPTRGLLLPQEFVPLAEDSGTIVLLGAWVLNEACRQVAEWHELRECSAMDNGRLNVSVNVSAVQLADPGFPRQVATAIESSGIDPDRLWLEITESTLMRDPDQVVVLLEHFREMGIHIEIDDFGTGYSSLSYRQKFPVESLKIDRSFISALDEAAESAAIVRAIIGLGKSLGMPVIAEGVERRTQVTILKRSRLHHRPGIPLRPPAPGAIARTFPHRRPRVLAPFANARRRILELLPAMAGLSIDCPSSTTVSGVLTHH